MVAKRDIAHQVDVKKKKAAKLFVRAGDKVVVIAGNDRKKEGLVKKVIKSDEKVIVEGVNQKKKLVRNESGVSSYQTFEFPIHISNVKVIKKSN